MSAIGRPYTFTVERYYSDLILFRLRYRTRGNRYWMVTGSCQEGSPLRSLLYVKSLMRRELKREMEQYEMHGQGD